MLINNEHFETIRFEEPGAISIIDQRFLPYEFVIERLETCGEVIRAIKDMHLRGAPLIGAAAAFGVYLSALNAPKEQPAFEKVLKKDASLLLASRPTAVNLAIAVKSSLEAIEVAGEIDEKIDAALKTAMAIVDKERADCRSIGEHGVRLIDEIYRKKGRPVNILTHCNAGWLACIDYGTATAPIYEAARRGIGVHVYVDETRPRNQGSFLTAFEFLQNGIPHTVIADNTGGHLMQRGMVDMVIVGSDRTTASGDVANKIGTYLKALAAKDNGVPFYVALTRSAFDFDLEDGGMIEIERRDPNEVKYITGLASSGKTETVLLTPKDSPALNIGFDVTPARLVTGLITERGICSASIEGIRELYPEIK